jgi:hypothetical protein
MAPVARPSAAPPPWCCWGQDRMLMLGFWQLQTLTHGGAGVEFLSRIFSSFLPMRTGAPLTAQVILPAAPQAPLQALEAMCS